MSHESHNRKKIERITKFEKDGSADSKLIGELERVQIIFAAAHGIMLSGFENIGTDRYGNMKFIYQEWWLVYK